jgi:hypothetical protein
MPKSAGSASHAAGGTSSCRLRSSGPDAQPAATRRAARDENRERRPDMARTLRAGHRGAAGPLDVSAARRRAVVAAIAVDRGAVCREARSRPRPPGRRDRHAMKLVFGSIVLLAACAVPTSNEAAARRDRDPRRRRARAGPARAGDRRVRRDGRRRRVAGGALGCVRAHAAALRRGASRRRGPRLRHPCSRPARPAAASVAAGRGAVARIDVRDRRHREQVELDCDPAVVPPGAGSPRGGR